MEVRHPYRHSYAGHKVPEFVFHIGPSPTNQLLNMNDYYGRIKDIEPMLANGHPLFDKLGAVLECVFCSAVASLQAEIRIGGWNGVTCPDLCIGTLYSRTEDDVSIYSMVTKEHGEAIALSLMHIFEADWVTCWHWPVKAFQVVCERKRAGSQERGGVCHESY